MPASPSSENFEAKMSKARISFLRNSASPSSENFDKFVSILIFVSVICFVCVKKRKVTARIRGGKTCRADENKVPTSLSLAEVRSGTMGFSRHRVVVEGASAKVYKGSLPSGGEVAVKRFERADGIGSLHNPFTTEFATMVGCLRHKNLIRLHGWCCEGKPSPCFS